MEYWEKAAREMLEWMIVLLGFLVAVGILVR
jgi:hypothetical protein